VLGLSLSLVVVCPPKTHQLLDFASYTPCGLSLTVSAVELSRGGDASAEIDELLVENDDVERPSSVAVIRRTTCPGRRLTALAATAMARKSHHISDVADTVFSSISCILAGLTGASEFMKSVAAEISSVKLTR